MKKILLFVVVVCLAATTVSAQANKSVFIEILGNGLGFSANFDARFAKKENGLGFRAGIGIVPGTGKDEVLSFSSILTIPAGLNYLAGKGPHYFEGGLGATYISGSVKIFDEEGKGNGLIFVPSAGYRYAAKGKGFQARIIISPLIGGGTAIFWGGISIGFTF
jgi:hypothetical protein